MLVKSQVKYIQSLGQKKFRDQEGVFVVEGPKMVRELLEAANLRPRFVYATDTSFLSPSAGIPGPSSGHLPASSGAREIPLTEIPASDLEKISFLSTPNQVLAVFERPRFPAPDFDHDLSLVLDGIQDPGNLGTIIRIADWFGIRQVVCSPDCADVYGPKTVQSTMGSISRVQTHYGDPLTLLAQHPDLPVYAAVLNGAPLYGMERISKGWIVIGNESKGIREPLLKKADHPVTIPGNGGAESLNAAVATGILLSHLVAIRH